MSVVIAAGALFYNARQVRQLRYQHDRNEKHAKMRATVDVVLHENNSESFQQKRKEFALLRDSGTDFAQFACGDLSEHAAMNDIILPVLNAYEFMAAGIRSGAFDEEIYKRMRKSTVIRDWHELSGYIGQIRNKERRQVFYVEFESIAKAWEKEPPNRAD